MPPSQSTQAAISAADALREAVCDRHNDELMTSKHAYSLFVGQRFVLFKEDGRAFTLVRSAYSKKRLERKFIMEVLQKSLECCEVCKSMCSSLIHERRHRVAKRDFPGLPAAHLNIRRGPTIQMRPSYCSRLLVSRRTCTWLLRRRRQYKPATFDVGSAKSFYYYPCKHQTQEYHDTDGLRIKANVGGDAISGNIYSGNEKEGQ